MKQNETEYSYNKLRGLIETRVTELKKEIKELEDGLIEGRISPNQHALEVLALASNIFELSLVLIKYDTVAKTSITNKGFVFSWMSKSKNSFLFWAKNNF